MIITMAQVLILLAIAVGLIGFMFMQYFTYRGLRRDAKQAELKRQNPRLVDVHQTSHGQIIDRLSDRQEETVPSEDHSGKNQALYYLHQEQMRRLMDAKLEMIRSTIETQNKISLLKAEVARLKAERDYKQAEPGQAGEQTRHALVEPPEGAAAAGNGTDNLGRLIEQHEQTLEALIDAQKDLKQEVEERIQVLESEIKAMPGSSPEAWATEQLQRQGA